MLTINHFNLSIRSYEQTFEIQKLIDNFPLDVELQGNKLVPSARGQGNRFLGYVQLQYRKTSKESDKTIYFGDTLVSIPPIGPIPEGAVCSVCDSQGWHKRNCASPNESSLRRVSDGEPWNPRAKEKTIFPNCLILKYNFKQGSVSIRVYQDGTVVLVGCPWDHKDFYKELLAKLSVGTEDSQEYQLGDTEIRSTFSMMYLDNGVNLEAFYQGTKALTRTLVKKYDDGTSENHEYLRNSAGVWYRTTIEYQNATNATKVILVLVPTIPVEDPKGLPKACKPYKITILIFASGACQLTMSHCDGPMCDIAQWPTPYDLTDQFTVAETELRAATNFLLGLLASLGPRVAIVTPPQDLPTTVSGGTAYRKPKGYSEGDQVEVWDPDTEGYVGGWVVASAEGDLLELRNGSESLSISPNYVRPVGGSAMKLSAIPPEGGFFSDCTAGRHYRIPFGGEKARDGLYHPKCEKVTAQGRVLYLSQVLDGWPTEQDQDTFEISLGDTYDTYSGVFRKGTILLGSPIRTRVPKSPEMRDRTGRDALAYAEELADEDGYVSGTVANYEKTYGRGLDNFAIWHIRLPDGQILYVTGQDLDPSLREDRRWPGIRPDLPEPQRSEAQRDALVRCTEKLGLSQSPVASERLAEEASQRILGSLRAILGSLGHPTSVLCLGTFRKLARVPYVAYEIPKGAHRYLLYVCPEGVFLAGNQQPAVIPLGYEGLADTIVLDGWATFGKNIEYFPVDCRWYNQSLRNRPYVGPPAPIGTSREPYELRVRKALGRYATLAYAAEAIRASLRVPFGMGPPRPLVLRNPQPLPYMDPEDPMGAEGNLIAAVAGACGPSGPKGILVFVPQSGGGSWLAWLPILLRALTLPMATKNTVIVPVLGEVSVKVPANLWKLRTPLRWWLNFRTDGTLAEDAPLLLDQSDPVAKGPIPDGQDAIVRTMLEPIPARVFGNPDVWEVRGRSGRVRLVPPASLWEPLVSE